MVEKGDTCDSIAKKLYGNRKHYELLHQYNPWLGAMPHRLEAGTKLVLPKSLPKGSPDAQITAARRRVEARSPDTSDWSSVKAGLDLWRGWRVNTHERSSAEITFRDDSRIEMRESTLVIIYGGSESKARRKTAEAVLDRGALRSRLGAYSKGKSNRGVTVTTPSAIAEFQGGAGLVTVDGDGTSRVANHGEGKAAVRSSGKHRGKVKIKPKMGSKVNKGKPPSKPKPLPPTPAWKAGGPTMFVALDNRGGTVHGEWGAVGIAKAYRVELTRQPDGREAITNLRVAANTHWFKAEQLPPGDYYVSIAAIDDDAFESPPSARRKLSVVPVHLRTPGAAPLPAAVQGDGTEAAGPTRVLRGTRLEAPDELRCKVDEGELSHRTVLDAVGEHTITCVTENDQPIPGFAVSVVDVQVAASSNEPTTAVRGTTTTTTFTMSADVPLPRRMWIDAPEGILASTPVPAGDGQWAIRVHADQSAANEATLRLLADAGDDEVELGRIALVVADAPSEPTVATASSPTPERHIIEGGFYGGVAFPSPRHGLFQEQIGAFMTTDEISTDEISGETPILRYSQLGRVAGSLGIRFGYYPIRWVGAEFEAGVGPTRVREGRRDPATLFAIRGQAVGQLPWRITPTVHVGGGVLGVAARTVLGREFDPAFHFGAGAKFYATRWLALRLDVRDVISGGYPNGVAHTPEVVLGISGVIGRRDRGKPIGGKKRKR